MAPRETPFVESRLHHKANIARHQIKHKNLRKKAGFYDNRTQDQAELEHKLFRPSRTCCAMRPVRMQPTGVT